MVYGHADVAEVGATVAVCVQDGGDRAAPLPGQEAVHNHFVGLQLSRGLNQLSSDDLVLLIPCGHRRLREDLVSSSRYRSTMCGYLHRRGAAPPPGRYC